MTASGGLLRCSCCKRMLPEESFPPKAFHHTTHAGKTYVTPNARGRGYLCRRCVAERRRARLAAGGSWLLGVCLGVCLGASCSSSPAPAAVDGAGAAGSVRRLSGPTACRTTGNVAPWVWHDQQPPTVGIDFRVYGTRGTTPLAGDGAQLYAWVVSHELAVPPLSTPAAPGCWLLVRPDAILVCYQRPPNPAAAADAFLEGGRPQLVLRFAPQLAGVSVFVQLLALEPSENYLGALVSGTLELVPGTGQRP